MLESILKSIFSAGTFQQMLRSATPVALAALGGSLTEHAGIMNIGMDGMILMGAFFGVLGSWLFASAAAGVALAVGVGLLVGLFFALFVVKLRSDEFIIGCALNTFALGLTPSVIPPMRSPASAWKRRRPCSRTACRTTSSSRPTPSWCAIRSSWASPTPRARPFPCCAACPGATIRS